MYKALVAQINANMGHLAADLEEQNVSDPNVISGYRRQFRPELAGGSRQSLAGLKVRILYETAAVETAW